MVLCVKCGVPVHIEVSHKCHPKNVKKWRKNYLAAMSVFKNKRKEEGD